MDNGVLTGVIGTLCAVIAFLYRREAAKADRNEEKYEKAMEFQRTDMANMINGYARVTMDYARIIRSERPDDQDLPSIEGSLPPSPKRGHP